MKRRCFRKDIDRSALQAVYCAKVKVHWPILAVGIIAAAFVGGLLVWESSREPSYQGKALSYWLTQLSAGYRGPIESAEVAIKAMGKSITPYLFSEVRAQDSLPRRIWQRAWRSTLTPAWLKSILSR